MNQYDPSTAAGMAYDEIREGQRQRLRGLCPSDATPCSPSSLTPETDALRDLYENHEHRVSVGDIWELCEGLEINLGTALAIIKGDDEKWRDYYVMPIVAEMKRRGIAEMHVVIKGGKAAYDLIPENVESIHPESKP